MYYKVYKSESFSNELLLETKKLGLNPTLDEIKNYVKFLNEKYKIVNVDLKIIHEKSNENNSRGCYIDYKKEIRFYGDINLITVLHELRHYIQFNSIIKTIFKTYDSREEEARGWSSSLFYAIYPTEYMKLTEQGKIKFI